MIIFFGLIFGIIALAWLVLNTNILDTLLVFLVAGDVPGTGIDFSADQMLIGEGALLGLLTLWLIFSFLPKRRPRQKAVAATTQNEEAVAQKTAEALENPTLTEPTKPKFALLGFMGTACQKISRSSMAILKRLAGLPVLSTLGGILRPVAVVLGLLAGTLLGVIRLLGVTIGRQMGRSTRTAHKHVTYGVHTFSKGAAKHTKHLYHASKPHAQRAWAQFKHEYDYAVVGTKVAAQSWVVGLKNSVPATRLARVRDQISSTIRSFL